MTKFIVGAALLLLPAAAFANSHMEKKDAARPAPAADTTMAAPAALPKCTAKLQDSCDQSKTTEKNALSYYPADARDAGNNRIGRVAAKRVSRTTTTTTTTDTAVPR